LGDTIGESIFEKSASAGTELLRERDLLDCSEAAKLAPPLELLAVSDLSVPSESVPLEDGFTFFFGEDVVCT